MGGYLKSENLKHNRTFVKKLIFIAPIFLILLALFIGGKYFEVNAFNWWYFIILPGHIALVTALINQKEAKKLHYRSVLTLPVSLRKIWIAKILLIAFYISISCIVFLAGFYLGSIVATATIPISKAFTAIIIMILTSLWQIPLCLFISKKIGTFTTILINVLGQTFVGLMYVDKSFWWACPYSWTLRLMTPILNILPNGCFAEQGNSLLNPRVIPIGVCLSILLFLLLMTVSSHWFENQEAK